MNDDNNVKETCQQLYLSTLLFLDMKHSLEISARFQSIRPHLTQMHFVLPRLHFVCFLVF